MNLRQLRSVTLTIAALAALASARLAPDSEPPHLREAVRLADAIKPEQTEYRHRPSLVHWPEDSGGAECRTDCSGFVDLLLRHSYSWISREWLENQTGKKRPLAGDLYDAIQGHKGFDPVGRIADVLPGDFIVMKYPVDSDNTGHAMLIESLPKKHAATEPLEPKTEQWEVAVIDETSSPHGSTDSRYQGPGIKNGGLGRGTFRIYTNPDGTFDGYTWSPGPKNKFYGPDTRPMVIARLKAAKG